MPCKSPSKLLTQGDISAVSGKPLSFAGTAASHLACPQYRQYIRRIVSHKHTGTHLATGGFIVQFLCEKIQGQELYAVLWMGQIIGKPKVKGALLPTLGWGKQSTWLAASGSPTPFAGVARTHSPGRGRHPQEAPCRGRVDPVCRFEGRGGGGAPVEGISAVLGRVWGGGCLGQSWRGNLGHLRHPIPEEERLLGPRFWALWGRSILVLG